MNHQMLEGKATCLLAFLGLQMEVFFSNINCLHGVFEISQNKNYNFLQLYIFKISQNRKYIYMYLKST